MAFTSTEIIAIIIALGGFFTGLGAIAVNVIVAIKTGSKVDSIAQVTAKSLVETGVLQGKVQEVHVLTNQNLSDVRNELKQANNDRAALLEVISDLKNQREKVETAAAYNTPTGAAPRPARASDLLILPTADAPPVNVKVIAEEPIPVEVQPVAEKKAKPTK